MTVRRFCGCRGKTISQVSDYEVQLMLQADLIHPSPLKLNTLTVFRTQRHVAECLQRPPPGRGCQYKWRDSPLPDHPDPGRSDALMQRFMDASSDEHPQVCARQRNWKTVTRTHFTSLTSNSKCAVFIFWTVFIDWGFIASAAVSRQCVFKMFLMLKPAEGGGVGVGAEWCHGRLSVKKCLEKGCAFNLTNPAEKMNSWRCKHMRRARGVTEPHVMKLKKKTSSIHKRTNFSKIGFIFIFLIT